jgi:hypothetical protein
MRTSEARGEVGADPWRNRTPLLSHPVGSENPIGREIAGLSTTQ